MSQQVSVIVDVLSQPGREVPVGRGTTYVGRRQRLDRQLPREDGGLARGADLGGETVHPVAAVLDAGAGEDERLDHGTWVRRDIVLDQQGVPKKVSIYSECSHQQSFFFFWGGGHPVVIHNVLTTIKYLHAKKFGLRQLQSIVLGCG